VADSNYFSFVEQHIIWFYKKICIFRTDIFQLFN
jgi:hypothetical protein